MRHGLTDAKGIADGEHDVADFQRIRIGEFEERKFLARILEAQHRQIGARILEHDGRLELALVGERYLDLVGAFDDVHIGDDEAGGVRDHAGAERALHLALSAGTARHAEEAAENRIVEQRVAHLLHGLGGVDVDHGRGDALHNRGIGQPQFGSGRHAAILRRGGRHEGHGGGQNGSRNRRQAHGVESRRRPEI